jgi:murein DD-endopeptidase MepM/ murein hydrolase activator NlpD
MEYTLAFESTETVNELDYYDSLVTDTVTVTAGIVGQTAQTASATASVCFGDCPEGCPAGWPTDFGYVTQGPNNPLGSHAGDEAIDIGVNWQTNVPVYATHEGDLASNWSATGGNYVTITSTCETPSGPVSFYSLYSHLASITAPNGPVVRGTTIGIVGSTGNSSAIHLHYEFVGGLQMAPEYIPEVILPQPCCNECFPSIVCSNNW